MFPGTQRPGTLLFERARNNLLKHKVVLKNMRNGAFPFLLILRKTQNFKGQLFFFLLTLILSAPQKLALLIQKSVGMRSSSSLQRNDPENKHFPNSAATRARVTGGESHQPWDALILILLCSLENLLLAIGEERKREQACMSCLRTHPAFPGTGGNSTIILACSVAI